MQQRSILFAFVYLMPSLCNGCFQWYQKMQTCVNCKPATECMTVTAETVTSTAAECKYSCFIGGTICDMAYRQHDSCIMFSKFHCNGVVEDAGEIVFRRTCISDCLEYSISSWSQKAGTCDTLNGTSGFNHTRMSCLTLCVDTKECRGSTYWIQSGKCELHTCDSMTDSDNSYFTSRTCFAGPSSSRPVTVPKYPTSLSEKSLFLSSGSINTSSYFQLTGETGTKRKAGLSGTGKCLTGELKMQTCVNCKPASECRIVTAARLTSTSDECMQWCSIGRSTCKMAYRPNINCMQFAQFHCNSLVEEDGERIFRLSCVSDCLEYKISSIDRHRGACDTVKGTGATNHTRLSCLSLCLDTAGCRASTFWKLTGICELHECDTMTQSRDTYFTSRTCFDELTSTEHVISSNRLSSLFEHPLSLSTNTVTMAPYLELGRNTVAEKRILGSSSINIMNILATNRSYFPESADISEISETYDITTVDDSNDINYVSTSPPSLNVVTVEMTKSFWHHAEECFAQPSNIAVVLAAGGVTVVGIIIVAGCKLAKRERGIIPVAST